MSGAKIIANAGICSSLLTAMAGGAKYAGNPDAGFYMIVASGVIMFIANVIVAVRKEG